MTGIDGSFVVAEFLNSETFCFREMRSDVAVTLYRNPHLSDDEWIRYVMQRMGWNVSW